MCCSASADKQLWGDLTWSASEAVRRSTASIMGEAAMWPRTAMDHAICTRYCARHHINLVEPRSMQLLQTPEWSLESAELVLHSRQLAALAGMQARCENDKTLLQPHNQVFIAPKKHTDIDELLGLPALGVPAAGRWCPAGVPAEIGCPGGSAPWRRPAPPPTAAARSAASLPMSPPGHPTAPSPRAAAHPASTACPLVQSLSPRLPCPACSA